MTSPEITKEEVAQIIGFLHMELIALRRALAEAQQKLAAFAAPKADKPTST